MIIMITITFIKCKVITHLPMHYGWLLNIRNKSVAVCEVAGRLFQLTGTATAKLIVARAVLFSSYPWHGL